MNPQTQQKIVDALASLDPDDLNFAAARYVSGERFRELIVRARCDDPPAGGWEEAIDEIAQACVEDGADRGNIPTLGGRPNDVWVAVCLAVHGDTSDLDAL